MAVYPGATTIDQGKEVIVSAAALSGGTNITERNEVFFDWSATPSSAVQIIRTTLSHNIRVRAIGSGVATVGVRATWRGATQEASMTINIVPLHFLIRASKADPLLNQAIALTVEALRDDGSRAQAYDGTVTFSADDPSAVRLPADRAFTPANFGLRQFPDVLILGSGPVLVTVRDTVADIAGSVLLFGNRAPVAHFTIQPERQDPRQITVDGTSSTDADGAEFGDTIVSYDWRFGDGRTASGPTVDHTFSEVREFSINLTVRDNHQASGTYGFPYRARAPPEAWFEVVSAGPDPTGLTIGVDASGSLDAGGQILEYQWNWGDGGNTVTTTPQAEHRYAAEDIGGEVLILLKVVNNYSLSGTFSRRIIVTDQNLEPVASFSVVDVDELNRTVRIDASGSWDPNGRDLAWYNWSWGDGTWTNGSVPTATHTFLKDQDFTILLRVGDVGDHVGSAERVQNISQPKVSPTARFILDRQLMTVTVDARASFDYNDDIGGYEWDWGDGQQDGPFPTPRLSHLYSQPGLYTITLRVIDQTGKNSTTTRRASVATSTIDHEFYDFFNVPWKEYWDIRRVYNTDHPIGAECFNATAVANGNCRPSDPNVPDVDTYPYTNWYALPGPSNWSDALNNPFIYAPYRWRALGVNAPGYNLSEPVFLPTLNYGQAPGQRLDFRWEMDYLDWAGSDALSAAGCPGVTRIQNDGYLIHSLITVTMDLQQSKRMFGVDSNVTTQGDALWWWYNKTVPVTPTLSIKNVDPRCHRYGAVETTVSNWFIAMGGSSTTVGKYDIANGYEWWYQPFYTQMTAAIETDGTTHVTIDTTAWGTEVLLARFLYWGNSSYRDHYLDSTRARGWAGMEVAWFEELVYEGSVGSQGLDFVFSTVLQYHFQLICDGGPDGQYNWSDDTVYWTWGPWLNDYWDNYAKHDPSELDRYSGPDGVTGNDDDVKYPHCTPGGSSYGKDLPYDYTPSTWNLGLGQTWHFQFPTGDVVFYNPNLTPVPAKPYGDPDVDGFVTLHGPLSYLGTLPSGYGTWDPVAKTWDVYGPADTEGPEGSPGNYPLEAWGSIFLGPG